MPRKIGIATMLGGLVCQVVLVAAQWKPVPVTVLQKRADVIVLATVEGIIGTDKAALPSVQLRVERVLQGQSATMTMVAGVVPPTSDQPLPRPSILAPGVTGRRGVWFLRSETTGYQVLPLVEGLYSDRDLCLPVNGPPAATAPGETVDQELLAYLVGWYQSLQSPSTLEDEILLANLQNGDTQELLAAISPLMDSTSNTQRIIGLTAAIRLGSDAAVSLMAENLADLRSNPRFPRITDALGLFYEPHGASSIPVLDRLIELHTDVAGVDAAAGAALAKIRTKAVLPAMAELLDSKDPQAQLRSASFFGLFTLFADKDGNMPEGGPRGPLCTAQTRAYMPRQDSTLTPAEYVEFWKGWWAQNRVVLGFDTL